MCLWNFSCVVLIGMLLFIVISSSGSLFVCRNILSCCCLLVSVCLGIWYFYVLKYYWVRRGIYLGCLLRM